MVIKDKDKVKAFQLKHDKMKSEALAANPKIYTCPVCGKTKRKMGNEKMCGGNCRKAVRAKRQRYSYIPKIKRIGHKESCALCGKLIKITSYNKRYCNDCQKKMACHYERRRNLAKRNINGTHTKAEFNNLCNLMNWTCEYCGKQLNIKTATEDHIIPLSEDGSDDIFNIAVACLSCNTSKGKRSVDVFIETRDKCLLGL